ncbi:glycosyltransferase, partial [Endobacter medicaginis]
IVENALDLDTLSAAEHLLARRRTRPGRHGMQIFYGAGSRTHDGDVAIAADALATILARHNRASLRIVGEVALPACLDPFADRIERLPPVDYHAYLALLADADINLAPLEDTPFNQAKSNIKFVEAGILAIPSVCSAAANFASAITDGVDGCLPRDTPSWIDALDRLVADPALRARMGEAARASVL